VPEDVRWIRHLDPAELAPLPDGPVVVRVERTLDDDGWVQVARLIGARDDVRLAVEAGEDLEGLRWLPHLRELSTTSLHLRTLEGLRHLAGSLERLNLGPALRPISLSPVAQLTRLRHLAINGTWKDLESTVAELVGLGRLAVGSIDVAALRPLTALRRFESGLSTLRNLDALPEIGQLELVELWRLRGEHDLAPLARIPTLRYLVLSSTRSITSLPSFADSPDLRWVALDEMRGIADLAPVAAAPSLEVLLLVGMSQLRVDDLRPFVGHPTLRAALVGLGSLKRNEEARALLGLPPMPGEPMPWTRPDWTGVRHPTET
jgi:hypothetical protein